MIDIDELDQKTVAEKWQLLTQPRSCPRPLQAFVGSRLFRQRELSDSIELSVELELGLAFSTVARLSDSLAIYFNLSPYGVGMESDTARARCVKITLAKEPRRFG